MPNPQPSSQQSGVQPPGGSAPGGAQLPTVLGGEELYDLLMAKIEPDLVSTALPTLDEKYKNETPAEAEARKKRYEAAFAEYEKQFKQYVQDWDVQMHAFKHAVVSSLEQASRDDENTAMGDLESAISTL